MKKCNFWKLLGGGPGLTGLNSCYGPDCNALLYGIPKTTMSRLQYVQNCAARLIRGARKFDHVTPLLIDLHWLPMTYRPMFKILLTVFKILQGRAPHYLTALITIYNPGRSLRSNGRLILNMYPALTRRVGATELLALLVPDYGTRSRLNYV